MHIVLSVNKYKKITKRLLEIKNKINGMILYNATA